MQITTDHKSRFTIDGFELSEKERAHFDYLDEIDSGLFFRYRGQLYDVGEFTRVPADSPLALCGFDGLHTDTYFSGIAIKLVDGGESVKIARFYS